MSGQPVGHRLRQPALAGHSVDGLQVARVAGDRPQQPLPPGRRLLAEAAAQQRGERHARIAQPAVAVVPVPLAAQRLRQSGRRRRDDAAGRRVGQRLEGDQRAPHGRLPLAPVPAAGRPALPPLGGLAQLAPRIGARPARPVRGLPGQHERHLLAGPDGELRAGALVLTEGVHPGRHPQPGRVGAGHRDPVVVGAPHPGHDPAVVEAQPQLPGHLHRAAQTLHDPDQSRVAVALRHEVDHPNGPGGGLPVTLQHQRAVQVAAPRALPGPGGREPPAAVPLVAEQCGEATGGVETGQAEPVDRSVPADQSGGLQVPDQAVVLDPSCHEAILRRPPVRRRAAQEDPDGCGPPVSVG